MTITSNEADRLMNFAAFIYLRNSDSCDADEATEFARDMFKQFAVVEGITDVEESTDYDYDYDDMNIEIGFNPYEGGYDYDC